MIEACLDQEILRYDFLNNNFCIVALYFIIIWPIEEMRLRFIRNMLDFHTDNQCSIFKNGNFTAKEFSFMIKCNY